MRQIIIAIIFTVFIEFCISTVIIIQQQQPQRRPNGPPPVPIPEIRHYPKQNNGNSSAPSNSTSPQTKSMEPPSQTPMRPHQPQPPIAPIYPQSQYQGGPQVHFVPLGQLIFGGPGYGYGK